MMDADLQDDINAMDEMITKYNSGIVSFHCTNATFYWRQYDDVVIFTRYNCPRIFNSVCF